MTAPGANTDKQDLAAARSKALRQYMEGETPSSIVLWTLHEGWTMPDQTRPVDRRGCVWFGDDGSYYCTDAYSGEIEVK